MKKLIVLTVLLFSVIAMQAQSKFEGFFKPVSSQISMDANKRGINDVWLVRPKITVSAMQIILSNPVQVQSLNSLGTGVSYAHFINQDGQPYQNFSADFLVLFGTDVTELSPLELSIAGTVTAWQYLNVGVGFNFMDKKAFILTGISYSFN